MIASLRWAGSLALLLLLFASCSNPLLDSPDPVGNHPSATERNLSEASGFRSDYGSMYYRGTTNYWMHSAMTLVADYTWEINIYFHGFNPDRFKFDAYADWSNNWGDNNGDGYADSNGADIPAAQTGYTVIRFNEQTRAYSQTYVVPLDVYTIPVHGALWQPLGGLTVRVDRTDGSFSKNSTIYYTNTQAPYAPFRSPGLEPGSYRATVDQIVGEAPNRLRYFGSVDFTVTNSNTPSPTLVIDNESAEPVEVHFDVYPSTQDFPYQESEGLTVSLYDSATDELVREEVVYSSFQAGLYAPFRNPGVASGSYVLRVDEVADDGYHYFGELSLDLTAQTNPTVNLPISRSFANGQVTATFTIQDGAVGDDQLLLGLSASLVRDGEVLGEATLVGAGYYNQPYVSFSDLEEGSYTLNLDVIQDGYRYQGTGSAVVTAGSPYGSVTIWVTRTAQDFTKNFPSLYLRGSFNNWSTQEMVLVADNLWEAEVVFNAQGEASFKFDVHGDWSWNYGDNNADGLGDSNGSNILALNGTHYIIRFNDSSLQYTLLPQ